MTEAVAKVCGVLCDRGYWKQAWALSGTVKQGGRAEVVKKWGSVLMGRKYPLDALSQARTNLERKCMMEWILADQGESAPLAAGSMSDFVALYQDKMAVTLKAMGERTPYTYQFVLRVKATGGGQCKVVDGEMLRRVFICFSTAFAAVEFVERWQNAQQYEIQRQQLDKTTCLLECGTYDQTLRKWVLDVDASIAELKKDTSLWPPDQTDDTLIKQICTR